MSVCKVCGKKVANINGRIIRGASGEWVCKECLKKAHVGTMKFSCSDISSGEIMSRICCESANEQKQDSNNFSAAEEQTNDVSNRMHCPHCQNTDLEIISDVKSKGASGSKLFAFGLLGFAGTGKVTTTHYWVCKKCGYKFKM